MGKLFTRGQNGVCFLRDEYKDPRAEVGVISENARMHRIFMMNPATGAMILSKRSWRGLQVAKQNAMRVARNQKWLEGVGFETEQTEIDFTTKNAGDFTPAQAEGVYRR